MSAALPLAALPWLRAEGIRKVYEGTVALDGVDFAITPGRVHVLVGENGAGKSTLMKILAGIEAPTAGRLLIEGREVRLRSSREAAAHGIGIIHQELNLCSNLTVQENIFLGREPSRGRLLHADSERAVARRILERLEHPIDPRTPVGDLPLGQQQIVEIAKALAADVRVLIMDEPTSALSGAEVSVLFRIIRDLTDRGVGIVYISHRLEELLAIGETVTVLRDGRVVAEAAARDIDIGWIVRQMIGRSSAAIEAEAHAVGKAVLEVESLTVNQHGRVQVEDATFSVRAGEILGIFGLMGAGRTELLEALAGVRPVSSGQIRLAGQFVQARNVAQRIALGIILVPEDRQAAGIVPTVSVADNLGLASVHRRAWVGRIRETEEREAVLGEIERLRVKTPSPDHPITALSGGNQQKVVIGRALLTRPLVLLLDDPGRGIDVAAKAEIFGLMSVLAGEGLAIVFVSSEVKEILAVSDRILVLSRGRITAELTRASASVEALLAASGGAHGRAH